MFTLKKKKEHPQIKKKKKIICSTFKQKKKYFQLKSEKKKICNRAKQRTKIPTSSPTDYRGSKPTDSQKKKKKTKPQYRVNH